MPIGVCVLPHHSSYSISKTLFSNAYELLIVLLTIELFTMLPCQMFHVVTIPCRENTSTGLFSIVACCSVNSRAEFFLFFFSSPLHSTSLLEFRFLHSVWVGGYREGNAHWLCVYVCGFFLKETFSQKRPGVRSQFSDLFPPFLFSFIDLSLFPVYTSFHFNVLIQLSQKFIMASSKCLHESFLDFTL